MRPHVRSSCRTSRNTEDRQPLAEWVTEFESHRPGHFEALSGPRQSAPNRDSDRHLARSK